MGTRSLTRVENLDGEIIIVMYRQYDGYPEGHGKELATFLAPMKICNGIGANQMAGSWANGMECLAAQMVAHFKKAIGGIYLHVPQPHDTEEYNYIVQTDGSRTSMTVRKGNSETLFAGSPSDFLNIYLKDLASH